MLTTDTRAPFVSIPPEVNSHVFFFFQLNKVSKREVKGSHPHFAMHICCIYVYVLFKQAGFFCHVVRHL